MDIVNINNILLDFFPVVLNHIILEYAILPIHEFELVKTVKYMYASNYCVNDYHNVYNYYNGVLFLVSTKIHEIHIFHNSKQMCAYKNHIYVIDHNYIYVFDSECKKIRTMHNYSDINGIFYDIIKVASDKIILAYKHQTNFVIVNDLYGTSVIVVSLKKLDVDETLYSVDVYEEHIYVLTYANSIYKYTLDGKLVSMHAYGKLYEHIIIGYFFVIDDVLYIDSDSPDGIHTVEDNNRITKKNITTLYSRVVYKNGYLYGVNNDKIIVFRVYNSLNSILSSLR